MLEQIALYSPLALEEIALWPCSIIIFSLILSKQEPHLVLIRAKYNFLKFPDLT